MRAEAPEAAAGRAVVPANKPAPFEESKDGGAQQHIPTEEQIRAAADPHGWATTLAQASVFLCLTIASLNCSTPEATRRWGGLVAAAGTLGLAWLYLLKWAFFPDGPVDDGGADKAADASSDDDDDAKNRPRWERRWAKSEAKRTNVARELSPRPLRGPRPARSSSAEPFV